MIFIIIGAFLIIMGAIIYFGKCYNLISGYNTSSKEQKEKVDIVGLSKFMFKCLIGMGLSFALSGVLMMLGLEKYFWIGIIPFIGITIYMIIYANKRYVTEQSDFDKKITTVFVVLISCVLIGAVLLVALFSLPAKVSVSDKILSINGIYSLNLDLNGATIELEENNMPKFGGKSNGFDAGEVKRGTFNSNGEKVYLNIQTKNLPVIIITKDGKKYYINCETGEKTRELYEMIKG